jgi:hypothetical protein
MRRAVRAGGLARTFVRRSAHRTALRSAGRGNETPRRLANVATRRRWLKNRFHTGAYRAGNLDQVLPDEQATVDGNTYMRAAAT